MSSTVPVAALVIWICSLRPCVVPVDCVEGQVVGLAVGQVHVDREAGSGVPDGGDAAGAAGVWRPRGSVVLAAQV